MTPGHSPGSALLRAELDDHATGGLRIGRVVGKVDVVLTEARATLAPPAREGDPECVENRSLARVVRTDEHRRVAEIDDKMPDRPEVLDLDASHAHVRQPFRWVSALVMRRLSRWSCAACSTALAGTS